MFSINDIKKEPIEDDCKNRLVTEESPFHEVWINVGQDNIGNGEFSQANNEINEHVSEKKKIILMERSAAVVWTLW